MQIRDMEKNGKLQQGHMVNIEEQNRELLKQIKAKRSPDDQLFDSMDNMVLKKVSKRMASIQSEISITGTQADELVTDL